MIEEEQRSKLLWSNQRNCTIDAKRFKTENRKENYIEFKSIGNESDMGAKWFRRDSDGFNKASRGLHRARKKVETIKRQR